MPTTSEALKIPVDDGDYINRGGGDAVEAFLNEVDRRADMGGGYGAYASCRQNIDIIFYVLGRRPQIAGGKNH